MTKITTVLMTVAMALTFAVSAFADDCCAKDAACCKQGVCCKNRK